MISFRTNRMPLLMV